MQDSNIINERLELIADGIATIERYCIDITGKDDFLKTTDTQKTLDAVMMRLQAIGENIKKIETLEPGFSMIKQVMM